nr:DUF4258 domain-containing protein [Pseudanabaena yagii]
MPMIEDIQTKIANEQYEFSKHAVEQSIIRQIRLHEIVEAIANGQYPNDKYAPSCLICGITQTGRFISKPAILAAHWLKSLQSMNLIRINGITISQ